LVSGARGLEPVVVILPLEPASIAQRDGTLATFS
jgi:hypothetical protein